MKRVFKLNFKELDKEAKAEGIFERAVSNIILSRKKREEKEKLGKKLFTLKLK